MTPDEATGNGNPDRTAPKRKLLLAAGLAACAALAGGGYYAWRTGLAAAGRAPHLAARPPWPRAATWRTR
jgi:hypothetical protein